MAALGNKILDGVHITIEGDTRMDKMGYTDKFHYTHAKSLILLIQHNTQGTQNRSQPKVPGRNRIDKNRH